MSNISPDLRDAALPDLPGTLAATRPSGFELRDLESAELRAATRPSVSDKASTDSTDTGCARIDTFSTDTGGSLMSPCPHRLGPGIFQSGVAPAAHAALEWLLSAEISEVQRVLAIAGAQRPVLFRGHGAEERSWEQSPTPSIQVLRSTSFDEEALRQSDAEAMAKEMPIVQFTAAVYFCHESEEVMIVDVARLGSQDARSEVHYTTEDVTARCGIRYKMTCGKLVFEPGELQKEIRVPIFYTADWEPTTEFLVKLLVDPAPTGCVPGRYLHRARVKVIDGGTFPSAAFEKPVRDGAITTIPKWQLLYNYVSLNFRDPLIRRGTIKMVVLDVSHNIYFLLILLMNVFLVDTIIEGERDEDPLVPLLSLAALQIVPFGVLYFFDGKRLTWRIQGASRKMLQGSLLRKFLNYSEVFRRHLTRGDVVMAMTRDALLLVEDGYCAAISLVNYVSQIFAISLFQMLAPVLFGIEFTPIPLIIACIFPVVLFAFLLWRRELTTRHVVERSQLQDALVAQVDRIVTNYPMIADYNRRPFFVTRYEKCIIAYNASDVRTGKVLKTNLYCAKWLTCLFVAFYTVMGGMQARRREIGVGMFLANIAVIQAIGTSMEAIYSILLDMQGTFPALENITKLLNAPIDLPERMAINRARRVTTTLLRSALRKKADVGLPIDRMTIRVVNLNFALDPKRSFVSTGELEVRQGQLVSLVGPKGEGKSSLLKVLGSVILPKPDVLFIPSHLRVLHISSEPLFFKGSLFDNLVFGVACDEDGQTWRVVKICKRLGLPQSVLDLVELGESGQPQPWNEVLSYTQRCLLCLARAIIANPELMCIHKPTMPFDEEVSINILTLLREFCERKGVEMDNERRHMRRPRTCIMTSSKLLGVKMSDEVFTMSRMHGIKRVEKDDVEAHMLN